MASGVVSATAERRQASISAPPRSDVLAYAAMVLVALALRLGYILVARTYQISAIHDHFGVGFEAGSIARSIVAGEGFASPFGGSTGPTAWLAPIYPYICALAFKLLGTFTDASALALLALNSVFSALTCVPICLIAKRVFGRSVALWSGWLWAVVPLFMRWPTTWIWEMSLSAFLLAWFFYLALKLGDDPDWRQWLGFGALWGVAALTNPSLLSCLPFTLAWPAWRLRRSARPCLRPAIIAILACVVVITPWLVRNRLVFGQFVFIRGNFGFEFHMGNFHTSNGMGWSGMHPTRNLREYENYKRLGELAYLEEHQRAAMAFVRQYPGEFVRLNLKRFAIFWDGESLLYWRPHDGWRPWMFWPLSLLAACGVLLAFDRRIPEAWLFATVLLFYPTAYYISAPQVRYRHALEPLLLMLSVFLMSEFLQRVRRHARPA